MRVEPYGGFTKGDVGGLLGGVAVFARYWIFQAGASYEGTWGGLQSRAPHYSAWLGALGVRLAWERLRVELLATAGRHEYSDVGGASTGGLLSSTTLATGVSGAMPFAGFRGGISLEWGDIFRFTLGARFAVESDLTREQRTHTVYSYPNGPPSSCLWSCDDSDHPVVTSEAPITLGGVQFGFMLVLGFGFEVSADSRSPTPPAPRP